ncbi:MAG TPA: FAD-binding oxidoreductase [Candidatus Janibacter merdipullorum]|nr:FAD-binding oxidoreductase [Candidatus Janibacter merdipullorum]
MADHPDLPRRSVWHGWGDPEEAAPLPAGTWPLLRFLGRIGPADRDIPPVPLEEVRLPEVRLSTAARTALEAIVGAQHVSTERLDRVEHAGGKGYPDLRRLRDGDGSLAPDAVAFPGDSSEVVEVLALCAEHEVGVIPFGGGTGTAGAEDARGPFTAVISLDLRRLDAVRDVDPLSQTVVVGAGVRGPEVEAALQQYELTLGHFPWGFQQATIGGFLATRSVSDASAGQGRFEDHVVAATLATPAGVLRLDRRGSGQRLLDALIGSEGRLGVVTEVTVQLSRRPRLERQETWAFHDTERGFAAFRDLAQTLSPGVVPDICRLSDAQETSTVMSQSGIAGLPSLGVLRARGWREPALAVFQLEGEDQATLRFRRKRLAAVLKRHGAARMPDSIAVHWMRNRFRGPYQRDRLMDRRVFVDTIDVPTMWGGLDRTYREVRAALVEVLGERSWVQCHVTRVDRGGACLRYTVMANGEGDSLAQWSRVRTAARGAVIAVGGVAAQHDDGGARIRRALRAELDPTGILNPGRLSE